VSDPNQISPKTGWTADGKFVIAANITTHETLESGTDPITGVMWEWRTATAFTDLPDSPFPMIVGMRVRVAVDENGTVTDLLEFVPVAMPDEPNPDDA
jgi:hypothetical protein